MPLLSYGTLCERGVVETGHFKLSSERHSTQYIVKERIFKDPFLSRDIVSRLARQFTALCSPEIIVGPETGGAKLAKLVAEEMSDPEASPASNMPWISLAKSEDGGGFYLTEEAKVLVSGRRLVLVDDVINTGGTLERANNALQEAGGEVVAVLTIIQRGVAPINFNGGIIFASLISFEVLDYDPNDKDNPCPSCELLLPITPKPTS